MKNKKFLVLALFYSVFAGFTVFPSDPPPSNRLVRIAVLTPTSIDNTYWPQVYSIMNAAADDLGIEIIRYEFDVGDRYARTSEGVAALEELPKADGAVLSVSFGQTLPLLQVAEELEIPVFIQGPIFFSERSLAGYNPGNKFKYWIGYFMQDEKQKGYELGRLLIDRAITAGATGNGSGVQIAGVSGDYSWDGTRLREEGLLQAVAETPGAVLLQTVPTLWSTREAFEKTEVLLDRYPEISVIWAASDQLALGASMALTAAGKNPGTDSFTGGLDLSVLGLEHTVSGELTATVSGSLFFYSQILVLLYDHIMGIDISKDAATAIYPEIYTATSENAGQYLRLYRNHQLIDYRKLSKYYNRDLESYDFSYESLLNSFKKTE